MGLCPLTEMGAPRERNDELKDCVAYVFAPERQDLTSDAYR